MPATRHACTHPSRKGQFVYTHDYPGVERGCGASDILLLLKANKPTGALYLFHNVTKGPVTRHDDKDYMVRDNTNRRLLDKRFSGRNAAYAYGEMTLRMSGHVEDWIDVTCRVGITWNHIRATDGMTVDQMIRALT
jgi:hypothetical protein